MGYRGKIDEQNRARDLRAEGWPYNDIAAELGVSKSSVSLWCRGVEIDEAAWAARASANRNFGARNRRPNRLQLAKAAEIEACRQLARSWVAEVSGRDRFIAGIALYAGEGAKTEGAVKFANSDPRMILAFVTWLREFFQIDESRLRLRLYLHQGLDLSAANRFWSSITGIPEDQFGMPYRAVADPSIRRAKHPMGCPSVIYSCSRTLRTILGLQEALLSSVAPLPG
jgi:transcriptional regulator with XRE-family HTH domain